MDQDPKYYLNIAKNHDASFSFIFSCQHSVIASFMYFDLYVFTMIKIYCINRIRLCFFYLVYHDTYHIMSSVLQYVSYHDQLYHTCHIPTSICPPLARAVEYTNCFYAVGKTSPTSVLDMTLNNYHYSTSTLPRVVAPIVFYLWSYRTKLCTYA